jgi:2-keto-4-pentenoate hydratase
MSGIHDEAARLLREAYATGPVPPLRPYLEPFDADGAYSIQTINTRYWQLEGRRMVGRKAGLTAASVQQQLGVEQPDFGVLFSDMQIPDGGVLDRGRLLQPKAEAEVAIVLGAALENPDTGPEDVALATASVHAAIEIVDSRIEDWKITFADTVADNGSSAFFVLAAEGKPLDHLDLYTCGMVLEVDGKVASLGAGAACLGHPLNAAAWLASAVARRGEPLQPGDIILTGALGPMVPIVAGQHFKAIIGGLGSVSFSAGGN